MDYVAYDPGIWVCHTMNNITDPLLVQAKLALYASPGKYSWDSDATVYYQTSLVSHQQVNQFLNVAAIGQGTGNSFKAEDKWITIRNSLAFIIFLSDGLSSALLKRPK